MTGTEKLLRELIALPSVNPALGPAGARGTGERQVSEFLAAQAARAGLELELREVMAGRFNLLARLSPAGAPSGRVLLAPHLDTVAGSADQFVPRRAGRRLHGRGACDTKGSVAAMFAALCDLARGGRRPRGMEIVFAGLVDEEHDQAGSRALAASGFAADLAIVGEPTRLKVVTAHKGSVWVQVTTRGREAHGSTPELGRNAIREMARVAELLETEYAARLRRRRHPLLGHGTINVGTVRGGTQPNIVPGECLLVADRRTLPGETEASVGKEIAALLRKHGLKAQLTMGKHAPCPPLETDPNLPLVRQFLSQAGQRRPAGVVYFSDAAVLSAAGIPTVVFGPGDIAQAHTADEWVDLDSLEGARRMLAQFLRSLP